MFTGIIETMGIVTSVIDERSNKTIWIESGISKQLKADESVNHDGVCLTVEEVKVNSHRVTAIEETLKKTNLANCRIGSLINLERSLRLDSRLDGHFVQGHVDTTALCLKKTERKGSWEYEFGFPKKFAELVIEKGSVCLNGISLTAYNVKRKSFTVAIIPYTYEHTNIKAVQKGDSVNIEFDLIGKYMLRKLRLE
jgi:riboflavin synthase